MNIELIDNSVKELLDESKVRELSELISFGKNQPIKYSPELTEDEGIYAFWLLNSDQLAENLNRKFAISGPNKGLMDIEWNWNLTNKQILLYVGKSTNLKKRISLHLKLKTKTWVSTKDNTLNKVTTSCQTRSGIEHLIQESKFDSFDFMNTRIGLTTVKLPNFDDRFFAEDLAIGIGKPWFNLDSER